MSEDKSLKKLREQRIAQHNRLEEIAQLMKFNKAKFLFDELGYDRYDMHYRAKKGERDYHKDFLQALEARFPEINMNYFLFGMGDPLKHAPKPAAKIVVEEEAQPYHVLTVMRDNSMADFIMKGDEIESSEIDKNGILNYGNAYVVLTDAGKLVRYLWPGEKDSFVLKSHNSAVAPDIEISKSQIKKLSKITRITRSME